MLALAAFPFFENIVLIGERQQNPFPALWTFRKNAVATAPATFTFFVFHRPVRKLGVLSFVVEKFKMLYTRLLYGRIRYSF
jgi:hypothetical protein